MKTYFRPNISRAGRIVRGVIAMTLLAAALLATELPWLGRLGLAAGGIFIWFEALRGWCALRACGVKTRW